MTERLLTETANLHELYAEYDATWAEMCADNDRYHAWRRENSITGPIEIGEKGQEIRVRLKVIEDAISEHGEQDFEPVFEAELAERIRNDDGFANRAYASLCNVTWEHEDGSRWSISWRSAGGWIAEIRDRGERYIDFYCNGGEGTVDDDIAEALAPHGWKGRTDHGD